MLCLMFIAYVHYEPFTVVEERLINLNGIQVDEYMTNYSIQIWRVIRVLYSHKNCTYFDNSFMLSCFHQLSLLVYQVELWNRKVGKSLKIGKNRKIGSDFLSDFLAKMPKCHKMPKCLHFRAWVMHQNFMLLYHNIFKFKRLNQRSHIGRTHLKMTTRQEQGFSASDRMKWDNEHPTLTF